LTLVKLPADSDSLEAQQKLERVGIITNRNQIPFDPKTPWRPSGLRLGTAALVSRGLTVDQARDLGQLIAETALDKTTETEAAIAARSLADELNWWYTA
jgi:glycine hydroxymethyltransferase